MTGHCAHCGDKAAVKPVVFNGRWVLLCQKDAPLYLPQKAAARSSMSTDLGTYIKDFLRPTPFEIPTRRADDVPPQARMVIWDEPREPELDFEP